MVAWLEDGLLGGYSPTSNRWEQDVYHLTPGSVDLNAKTRIGFNLPVAIWPPDHPNRIQIQAHISFDSGDFADNPGTSNPDGNKGLTVGAFAVKASKFADGVVPTPKMITDLGYNRLLWWSASYVHGPISATFPLPAWTPDFLEWNTKYWLLVFPAVYNGNLDVPLRPMEGVNLNTVGRVVSFWTSQKPGKPVITSPLNNTEVAAGSILNFKYTPSDPDSVGTDRYDRDLAGVQVAYAPLPTADNPNPVWSTMAYRRADNNALVPTSVYMNQEDVLAGDDRISMLNNLGFPIKFGAGEVPHTKGQAALPAGKWQLKVRTCDYGNPYPTLPNNRVGKYPGFTSFNQVNEQNLSPWSDVVRVSVFQQVPPPVPVGPKGEIAIPETSAIRLAYLYRNTFDPPYNQYSRTVQIRQVGEDDWHMLRDGEVTTSTTLTLPAGFSLDVPPDPIPAPTVIYDGTFEDGLSTDWVSGNPDDMPLAVVTGTAGAGVHTGTKALRLTGDSHSAAGYLYIGSTPVPDEFNTFQCSFWVRVNEDIDYLSMLSFWVDADGQALGSVEEGTQSPSYSVGSVDPNPYSTMVPLPGGNTDTWTTDEWIEVVLPPLKRPPGAVSPALTVVGVSVDPLGPDLAQWHRIDDMTITASYEDYGLAPFVLDAMHEYEWHVKVADESFTEDRNSDYSVPARFWLVPGAGTGEVRPLPESTVDGAALGCGTHRAFIYRRGGKIRVGEIRNFSHLDWGRVRDDISTSKIVISDWDIDCGNLLASLQTWAYEVVIYRDNGYSVDRVWEGPITLLTYARETVTIDAKDVMGFAYRRIIRQAMNDTGNSATAGRSVVERATQVLQNAFAPDDPNVLGYLTPINNDTDAKQYRSTPEFSRTAFEEVDDMAANAGLDYTVMGRTIMLWGTKTRIGTLPEFRDEDLGSPPIVSEYGMSFANLYSVSDGNGIHGEASRLDEDGNDDNYGRVEMLSSTWASDSTEDIGSYTEEGRATIQRSFEEYAERSISDRYPPPVVVRVPDNTTLNPSTVLSIQHLVPGVVIPLRSTGTLRTVVDNQKLDSMTVTEESGNETITITLSPFTREDAVAPEGGEEV